MPYLLISHLTRPKHRGCCLHCSPPHDASRMHFFSGSVCYTAKAQGGSSVVANPALIILVLCTPRVQSCKCTPFFLFIHSYSCQIILELCQPFATRGLYSAKNMPPINKYESLYSKSIQLFYSISATILPVFLLIDEICIFFSFRKSCLICLKQEMQFCKISLTNM